MIFMDSDQSSQRMNLTKIEYQIEKDTKPFKL